MTRIFVYLIYIRIMQHLFILMVSHVFSKLSGSDVRVDVNTLNRIGPRVTIIFQP